MLDLRAIGLRWRRHPQQEGERLSMLRYHGVWGPGVRLLQNLRFRNKALLLVICLVLPMSYLVAQAWQSHQDSLDHAHEAVAVMALYRLASEEQSAIGILAHAIDSHAPVSTVTTALRHEAGRAEALRLAIAQHVELSPDVRKAHESVEHLRSEVLPGIASGPGQRPDESLVMLERLADALRTRLLKSTGPGLRDDPRLWSTVYGGLDRVPTLARELRVGAHLGEHLLRQAPTATAVALLEQVATIQMMLNITQTGLQPALALGVVDSTLAHQQLDLIDTATGQLRQLARGRLPAVGAGAVDLTLPAQWLAAETAAADLHRALLDATEAGLRQRESQGQHAFYAEMSLVAGSIALMVYLLVCLNKVVGGGLRELATRVDALAQGDLSEKPEARGSDEVGLAMTSLAASIRRMSSLFEAVTQGVAAVSHASREVATGNSGLRGRTGDIQRSIGDVGERARSSMEAMNRAGDEVERIADHMRAVRADAHRSRKAMNELQTLMRGLQTQSREIGRVVVLVESVAHQTRLLSLNASVEAARAGTAGKGFAVVAQEVRDLARRSETAAHKIAEIVQASVSDIEAGGQLSARVGESVRLTDERVAEVSAIMGDIVRLTHAGREHSNEVVGITRDVEDSAGGNARMVDQLAQASADLRVQGDNLKRSMQHFVFG